MTNRREKIKSNLKKQRELDYIMFESVTPSTVYNEYTPIKLEKPKKGKKSN